MTTSTALVERAGAEIARGEPVVGRPAAWARDMALMGGGSLATMMIMGNGLTDLALLSTLVLTGALSGALLGGGLAVALERLRGRLSLTTTYLLGTAATAMWGVAALGSAAWWLMGSEALWGELGALLSIGSGMGIVLFGWLWFAYTVSSVLRMPRWPLVALSLPWAALTWSLLRLIMVG